ncbi:hypothetical protein DPSP01_010184 [Paraphaeosphaeria sporulosa]|uniref:Uncharacterized protein n=1 Tax=Paraphaeosphaeria sporulosa TaxID=1460663 RepID=A0A177D0A8_9PLEO|nr:uncharacterized protein CC84DRAFT_1159940 [Paraphaeosphaeria sporulosa]OAG12667.1 hypothetical protein CC84DRAFT_1159940 [Paraphaeosphaeria sporulosa]
MNSGSRLLNIPRELRDKIVTLVLTHRHPSPQTTAEVEAQDRLSLKDVTDALGGSAYYLADPSSYIPNAVGLLRASKQLRSETKSALERLDLAHELEIKFVNEQYLAATWTLVPTPTKHCKRVHASFQSMGVWQKPALPSRFQGDPWIIGDGGPPSYVWIFYNTLVHFLTYGVNAPHAEATPGIVSVERLELDFINPEEMHLLPPEDDTMTLDVARCGFPSRSSRRPRITQGPELLRPEWLARALNSHMHHLFNMSYQFASYGRMFHGRIGTMIFKVNGNVIDSIDVGQLLAELKFYDSFGDVSRSKRVNMWIEWKQEAQKERKEHGLETVAFKDGWKEEARKDAAEYYRKNPSMWGDM